RDRIARRKPEWKRRRNRSYRISRRRNDGRYMHRNHRNIFYRDAVIFLPADFDRSISSQWRNRKFRSHARTLQENLIIFRSAPSDIYLYIGAVCPILRHIVRTIFYVIRKRFSGIEIPRRNMIE